jgi:hypothetical protein
MMRTVMTSRSVVGALLVGGFGTAVALIVSCSGGGNGHPDHDIGALADAATADRPAGLYTDCKLATSVKQLSNLPGSHGIPRIGFNGIKFVVAWNTAVQVGANTRYRIDVAVTDTFGNIQGPNIPMTSQPVADPGPPSVSPLLGGTAVAWTNKDWANGATNIILNALDSLGQRLDASNQPCDPAIEQCGQFQVTTSDKASAPFLARPRLDDHTAMPTQDQVGLVWVDARNYPCTTPCLGFNDIYWKKVSGNGTTLVPDRSITAAGLNH